MAEDKKHKLNDLLESIFQPLSKLLVKNDIPIQQVTEILKRRLIAAATVTPKETDSHVSLKTGVHRKDVRRIRAELQSKTVKKLPSNPMTLVLTKWEKSEMFQSDDGKPLPLTRADFDELVRSSKVDLPPATVLRELLNQNLVREDDEGLLHLQSQVYLPNTAEAALLAFRATIADHLRVAVDNTVAQDDDPKAFDRVLRYSHLSESSVAQLEHHARASAVAYLDDLNTMAFKLQQRDAAEGHIGRFVSGVYVAPEYVTQDQNPK